MKRLKDDEMLVTVVAPISLKEKAAIAAKKLDSDLSKELRRAMRDLIARAELEGVA